MSKPSRRKYPPSCVVQSGAMAPLMALYATRMGAASIWLRKRTNDPTAAQGNNRMSFIARCLKHSFRSDAGERIDLHDFFGVFLGHDTLRHPALLHRFHRVQNIFAQQDHAAIRRRQMLVALVDRTLSSLSHDVFVTNAAPKRRVFAAIIVLLFFSRRSRARFR